MSKRFIVDFGAVKLSDKVAERIENAVQRAALSTLADIDFRGDLVARFPREWLGLWIDIGRDLQIDDARIADLARR